MADASWAKGNEDVVIAYLKAHLRAHSHMRNEPELSAAIIAEASGFPVPIVASVISRIRWDASLYDKDVQTLNRLSGGQADWLPTVRTTRGFAHGKHYLQYAAEALKLPALPDAPLSGEWSHDAVY
ncbi:MAG: hypothetical protein K0Q59_5039 [Paenibacillus sp.]|nr:hypothetical protein [Paenibacillus sp.]